MPSLGTHHLSLIKEATGRYWVSARQVMQQVGLNRQELKRYVKLGILPNPVIRYDGRNCRGSFKNGYFPKSVVERVQMAEKLRRQGHPLDQIAKKFKAVVGPDGKSDAAEDHPDTGKQDRLPKPGGQFRPEQQTDGPVAEAPDTCSGQSFREQIATSPGPVSVNLAALAVELNQWRNWRNRLPTRQYYSLLKCLFSTAADLFNNYKGISIFQPPAGLVCLFVEVLDKDYLSNAVRCALELQLASRDVSQIRQIEQSHKTRVRLNMGLHAGMEPLAGLDVSGGKQIISLGNIAETASMLAEVGCDGQIWASKDLFSRLPEDAMETIKFGVSKVSDGWEVFLTGCFATIQELEQFNDLVADQLPLPMKGLIVTQVIESQS